MSNDLKCLFKPNSIAVIGATDDLQKPGGRAIHYLKQHGYKGEVSPINPKRKYVQKLRCFGNLNELHTIPDLVIIALKAELVCESLMSCQELGVPAVNIYSSGFSETNESGFLAEQKLCNQMKQGKTIVCGPNSQGVADFHHPMVAYFSSEIGARPIKPGPIGFVGHSGVMGGLIAREFIDRGIGIGALVSLGNEVGINLGDVINYMSMDPNINVIGAYVEGVKDVISLKESIKCARKRGKYVVILKAGKSEVSKAAAASHTAAISGDWITHVSAFRQWGAFVAEDLETLMDSLELFGLCQNIPKGKGVGIITNSGGIGVMCADALASNDIEVPMFSERTELNLSQNMLPFASSKNPVDVTLQWLSDPSKLSEQINCVITDENIDILMPFPGVIRQHVDIIISQIASKVMQHDKPIIAGWLGGDSSGPIALRQAGIPTYSSPMRAARMVRALCEDFSIYSKEHMPLLSHDVQKIIDSWIKKSGPLSEFESRKILEASGIPMSSYNEVKSIKKGIEFAKDIGFPVALKVSSSDIIHKASMGGVALNITSPNALRIAAEEILNRVNTNAPRAKIYGFLVEKMVQNSLEIIVGMRRDETFGSVIVIGVGGGLVEFSTDKVLLIPPFSSEDVRRSIKRLKIYPLIKEYESQSINNEEVLIKIVMAVASLTESLSNIREIDINPIAMSHEGTFAIDSLVIIE